jgi:trehalose/maltose hydrolase-like predicted phosphorylase
MKTFYFISVFLLYFQLHSQDFTKSPWHIQANTIDPNNYYGITVANGMVGMVSSADPLKVNEVILNGVYDYYQRGRVSNILQTFSHMNMHLEVDKRRINRQSIQNYAQTLDMKTAKLITTFDVGNQVKVKQELFSLRNLPYTAMAIVEITAQKDVEIVPINYIETPNHISDVRNLYSEIDRTHVLIPLMSSVGFSPGGKKLATATSFIFPEKHGKEPKIIHEDWDYNMHLMKFKKNLKKGETYRFALVGSTISTVHNQDPHNEAERLTIYAKLEGIERLENNHLNAWNDLWKSDIQIEGDLESQRAVRSALYHLYSFARKGTAYSLSPMGLSGLGYNGHVFWDTELWMYPPLLAMQPDIAKSLLEYRFQRLDAAKENAFAHGYDGAQFPWESAEDGSEDTPVWALTGPFQQHISATVGWAFWKYYQVTKDKEWLASRGYPVLKEVAKFWSSRVERKGTGRYEINNVIGANEWEENIDNNAFTNGMVKTVMEYASKAAEELGFEADPDWRHVAENIPILKFSDGTTKENETYSGVMIKQGDVNLLAYPLKVVTKKEDIQKDLAYYEPRLSPEGPAMGGAILSVLSARLGNPEKAYQQFIKSYKPNELPPFGVIAETAGGTNPYFATGAGGMLQAVIFGIGGLDITDDGIVELDTQLPKQWKSLTLTGVGKDEKTYTKE